MPSGTGTVHTSTAAWCAANVNRPIGNEQWLERVARFAAGAATARDVEAIARGFACWLDAQGDMSLEQALCVEGGAEALRVLQRNHWINQLGRLHQRRSAWKTACDIHDEWEAFLCRGPWRRWRDDGTPPAYADPRQVALFWASRFNRGNALGAKQLGRIIGLAGL